MGESTIPSGCPDRSLFLGLEHDQRILIELAETADGSVPFWRMVSFLLCQNARLEHEGICPKCAAELGLAAA